MAKYHESSLVEKTDLIKIDEAIDSDEVDQMLESLDELGLEALAILTDGDVLTVSLGGSHVGYTAETGDKILQALCDCLEKMQPGYTYTIKKEKVDAKPQ